MANTFQGKCPNCEQVLQSLPTLKDPCPHCGWWTPMTAYEFLKAALEQVKQNTTPYRRLAVLQYRNMVEWAYIEEIKAITDEQYAELMGEIAEALKGTT